MKDEYVYHLPFWLKGNSNYTVTTKSNECITQIKGTLCPWFGSKKIHPLRVDAKTPILFLIILRVGRKNKHMESTINYGEDRGTGDMDGRASVQERLYRSM